MDIFVLKMAAVRVRLWLGPLQLQNENAGIEAKPLTLVYIHVKHHMHKHLLSSN